MNDPSRQHIPNARESDGTYFFAIRDPQGVINHTTIGMDENWSVEQFLTIENTMLEIYNSASAQHGKPLTHGRSWEQFEAEGFSITTVRIVECEDPEK